MTDGERQTKAASAASRLDALAARIPLALAVVVLGGVILRLLLELSYRPAVLTFADTASYVRAADGGMFDDATRAVGYPIFLDLVHAFSTNLERTIELQHLIGLAAGIVLYAAVRRLGAPIWVALIGACAVLLSLDQIHLEHTPASESPFTLLYAAMLYAAVRTLDPGRHLAGPLTTRALWLAGTGLLLGLAIWVRAVGVTLIPFLALWVAFAIPGSWTARAGRAALASAPAIALVLLYMILNNAATGSFWLIQSQGWGTYARTAPFADCSQFTPPEGTEELCESIPPEDRPAPDFYTFNEDSPAQREFGLPPVEDGKVGDFGRAALWAQPTDYVRAVGNDFLRYFFPDLNARRPFTDAGFQLEISYREEVIEDAVRATALDEYYDPVGPVEVTGLGGALADIQQLLRVHPILLLQGALFGIVGLWFTRGRLRAGIVLLGGSALLMLLTASAVTYAARFATPVAGPLLAAGGIGLWALLQRYRAEPAPQAEPTRA